MKTFKNLGIGVPELLLPRADLDMTRWAVVACDQYTSEPEYWQRVADLVKDAPSTLHLIYPEAYLGEPESDRRVDRIRAAMRAYLEEGVLEEKTGFVYLERRLGAATRHGLMVALDLDAYDYNKSSRSLVRPTEGTMVERLAPRIKVRQGAPIELPHIMVLIDDPDDTVIGAAREASSDLPALYDFELMLGGGHLAGWLVDAPGVEAKIADALATLADPVRFAERYDVAADVPPLLYAMGDGNHSLATAKAIWDEAKKSLEEGSADPSAIETDPRRYALVELVNLHDEALVFEPIHRVLFDIDASYDLITQMKRFFEGRARFTDVASLEALTEQVDASTSARQRFGVIWDAGYLVVEVTKSDSNIPIGSAQAFLDPIVKPATSKRWTMCTAQSRSIDLEKSPGTWASFSREWTTRALSNRDPRRCPPEKNILARRGRRKAILHGESAPFRSTISTKSARPGRPRTK